MDINKSAVSKSDLPLVERIVAVAVSAGVPETELSISVVDQVITISRLKINRSVKIHQSGRNLISAYQSNGGSLCDEGGAGKWLAGGHFNDAWDDWED
jgi:hypothetical protein